MLFEPKRLGIACKSGFLLSSETPPTASHHNDKFSPTDHRKSGFDACLHFRPRWQKTPEGARFPRLVNCFGVFTRFADLLCGLIHLYIHHRPRNARCRPHRGGIWSMRRSVLGLHQPVNLGAAGAGEATDVVVVGATVVVVVGATVVVVVGTEPIVVSSEESR